MNGFLKGYIFPISLVSIFVAFFLGAVIFLRSPLMGQFGQASSGILRATVAVNPLFITLLPVEGADTAKPFPINATIENRGEVRIENLTARLFLPAELQLTGGDSEKKVGVLGGGNERMISWKIKAGTAGVYIVSVSAAGTIAKTGDLVYAEDSTMFEVNESGGGKPKAFLQTIRAYLQIFLDML